MIVDRYAMLGFDGISLAEGSVEEVRRGVRELADL